MRFPRVVPLFVCLTLNTFSLFAQSPNGNINGLVSDPSNAAVVGAEIVAVNDVTGVQYTTKTNGEGIYVLPNLPPGPYRVQVSTIGFKTLIKPDITLNVQDSLSINFTLLVGAFHEVVTVEGGGPVVNTENAAVSTVVDRQFAENLPMNGRSFQTLIQLTPGIVLTPSSVSDSGQFSANGQRASSNYWMVDGVSANIGASPSINPGNGVAGTLGSFSVLGGTNSLVSVDALQEFRIQTSTYAPEFGRTPGAQISILTRSGTNQYHGTAFDYLRNDIFDASNWFNGYNNNPPLPKSKERQNDFGGTFSGPILKDRTFFFFSYEGLRLRLPQTELTQVPDLSARKSAAPAIQPYLNAFPFDPRQPDLGNGAAQFNASYSDPASLDAYSLRVDHHLRNMLNIFGRYDYSPSQTDQRGQGGFDPLSNTFRSRITTHTATIGATWGISSTAVDDLRFNFSRINATSFSRLDTFGGAVPLGSLPFPAPFNQGNGSFGFGIYALPGGTISDGRNAHLLQRQYNLVDSFAFQKGTHGLKFGIDYRRLSPLYDPQLYSQNVFFLDVPSAEAGNLNGGGYVASGRGATLLLQNLGAFAEDAWRVIPRLTLTYGLRWDVDFAPSSISGPNLLAVTGFNLSNLSQLALAPVGTPPFNTTYGNVAPRVGVAYEVSPSQNWQTVIRGGFGVFFDLADQEAGSVLASGSYPFGATNFNVGTSFPLDATAAAAPAIIPQNLATGALAAFNPHLELPYTLQWSFSVEQGLGTQQKLSATYIGSRGRRLIQTASIGTPNPNFAVAQLATNAATSDYDALQLQFQRRLSQGLQALASYSWSHSIDTASAGSLYGNYANGLVPGIDPNANRGPSDFDIRNAFSAGITYDVPALHLNRLENAILGGWSLQSVIQFRSAPPVNVYYSSFTFQNPLGAFTAIRPDALAGTSFYLEGSQFPGGKAFNSAAFASPPVDPNTGLPERQGDLGRNGLRGFGAAQWDFSLHRDFPIHDALKVQFRAEMFNLLNHPNFGQPVGNLGSPSSVNPAFGLSNAMLGQFLSGGNVGGGGYSPLYQLGGPRSIQFALKLMF